MNYPKRLEFASKVAHFFSQNGGLQYPGRDCCWLVGMFCDTSISDAELVKHLEDTKKKFPEYAHLLNWKDVVYCVFGYPSIEGAEYPTLDKIFAQRVDAENYMNEENKKAGWRRVITVDEETIQ